VAEMDWAELTWRKSSWSAAQNCVSVAMGNNAVFVRDSKDPNGPFLKLTSGQWDAFLKNIRRGHFV
jgi:hypothetical protein